MNQEQNNIEVPIDLKKERKKENFESKTNYRDRLFNYSYISKFSARIVSSICFSR